MDYHTRLFKPSCSMTDKTAEFRILGRDAWICADPGTMMPLVSWSRSGNHVVNVRIEASRPGPLSPCVACGLPGIASETGWHPVCISDSCFRRASTWRRAPCSPAMPVLRAAGRPLCMILLFLFSLPLAGACLGLYIDCSGRSSPQQLQRNVGPVYSAGRPPGRSRFAGLCDHRVLFFVSTRGRVSDWIPCGEPRFGDCLPSGRFARPTLPFGRRCFRLRALVNCS